MAFEEQKFVIAGASKPGSIGFTFIQKLLAIGVQKIAIFDIIEPSEAIEEFKLQYPNATVLFHKVDVRKRADIENAFKKVVNTFGYVDVLANFAGILNEARIEDVIDINLLGVIYGTFVGIENMGVDKGGHGGMIVNMASICALDGFAWGPMYCASKHGVAGFTKSLAKKELNAELGIKFVLICPGFTDTNLFDNLQLYGKNNAIEFPEFVKKFGMQTGDECINNLVEVLKKSENGSAWILAHGKHTAVNFNKHY